MRTSSVLLVLIGASSAFGGTIVSSSTGLANPGRTLLFDEIALPNSTVLTTQYAALGVSFSGFYYNGCPGCSFTEPTGTKPDIGNFLYPPDSGFNQNLTISFNSPVTDAAFQVASNPANFTFTAFLGSTQVDSFTKQMSSPADWGWYGFTGATFDRITIDAGAAMEVDNLSFNSVPEPSSLALTGIGLLLAFVRMRR